jgi:hypothetical protein
MSAQEFLKSNYHQEKGERGLDSPFATLLLIALPDFVIAVGCHSNRKFDYMV